MKIKTLLLSLPMMSLCCFAETKQPDGADMVSRVYDDGYGDYGEIDDETKQPDGADMVSRVYDDGYDGYGEIADETTQPDSTAKKEMADKVSRVYAGGYGGYGVIDGMYRQDGQFGQFRLSLGCDAYTCHKLTFGVEGGIQSGNTMRMQMKNTNRNLAGGLYPQLVLKPVIDLLATVRYNFISKYDLLFKAGAAYRQMQLTDRTSSKDSLRSVNGELQAGLGYQLTKHTRLVGLYQGIYAHARVKYSLTSTGNYIQLGHIPLQQAGFFGVEYAF